MEKMPFLFLNQWSFKPIIGRRRIIDESAGQWDEIPSGSVSDVHTEGWIKPSGIQIQKTSLEGGLAQHLLVGLRIGVVLPSTLSTGLFT
jgi:hypothetical protein